MIQFVYPKRKLGTAMKWYREINSIKEKWLCYALIVLSIILKREKVESYTEVSIEEAFQEYSKNLNNETIEIDDYVQDMHTYKGKSSGKNSIDFSEEGSFVENESKNTNIEYRKFYEAMKIVKVIGLEEYEKTYISEKEEKSEPKESDMFDFTIRAQLTCSNSKQCTYFAVERATGNRVCVKGPYLSEEHVNIPLKINKCKKWFKNLLQLEMRKEFLIPDFFPNVPLGTRTKVDRNSLYPFLIMKDMTTNGDNPKPFVVKSSKLWEDEKVVEWSFVKNCVPIPSDFDESSNLEGFENYILCVLFRFIIGIGDLANRNFLYFPDTSKVYSIDEEHFGHEINLLTGLRKTRYKNFEKYVSKNRKKIAITTTEWYEKWNEKGMKKFFGEKEEEMKNRCEKIYRYFEYKKPSYTCNEIFVLHR
jgi:hypothetical protein